MARWRRRETSERQSGGVDERFREVDVGCLVGATRPKFHADCPESISLLPALTRVTWRVVMVLPISAMIAAAQDPTILQIRILEGEDAVYATGSRATRGITVLVTGETGKPVDGATLSFRLPAD